MAIAEVVSSCLVQEYPHKLDHLMVESASAKSPRELHPSFYGSYDWHSAVHCTWSLVRLLKEFELGQKVEVTLCEVLGAKNLAGELDYLHTSGHASFERPYGLAWLLKLAAELAECNHPEANTWRVNLAPIASVVEDRMMRYLEVFDYPVRVGTHANTAFALRLALEYATVCEQIELTSRIRVRAADYYLADQRYPDWMEPCGGDFLSPALTEADLMSAVLPNKEFVGWFDRFLPSLGRLVDVPRVADRTDPSVIHLDGLCLSKAWSFNRIAAALPESHPLKVSMLESGNVHAKAGLAHVPSGRFLGDHWLPSFAVYLDSAE